MERAATIDFTKVQARARAITATIIHKGTPHPTFARASQKVLAATMLLDTLPAPSIDGVDKVYRELRDILGVATEQQVVGSL
jgi:hypothetical protein